MKATDLLKKDHDEVKGLFDKFEKARAKDQKQKLAEQIFMELEVHEKIEEERFYPEVREEAKKAGSLVKEGIEEHHVMDLLMKELKGMSPDDEQYEAKMTVLREQVEHHVKEEEEEMFPAATKAFDADYLEEMGKEMEQRKESLLAKAG